MAEIGKRPDGPAAADGLPGSGCASQRRTIVLVGLPGSGKTWIGPMLAQSLQRPFFDSDEEVERIIGRSISAFFAEEGEAAFRTLERAVIGRLLDEPGPSVVAIGGGGFSEHVTRTRILAEAVAVWLDVKETVLVERLRNSGARPLFEGKDVTVALRELSAARLPHYAQAQIRIAGGTSTEMVDGIVAALRKLPEERL